MAPEPTDRQSHLDEEALDWLIRLGSGRASAEDHAAFRNWRLRSPAHGDAACAAERLWADLGETDAARLFVPSVMGDGMPAGFLSRRKLLFGAATASAIAVTAGGLLTGTFGHAGEIRTATGERRSLVLPDGSTAHLNTGTAISLGFTPEERRIVLHAGEALFDVRKNPARPFILAAGGLEATALGTVYGMRMSAGGISTLVLSGRVGLRETAGDLSPIELQAGEEASLEPGGTGWTRRAADVETATAWRRGKLIFHGKPLAEVVGEIGRYLPGRVLLLSPDLERLTVTGVFDLTHPGELIPSIARILPVHVAELPYLTAIY